MVCTGIYYGRPGVIRRNFAIFSEALQDTYPAQTQARAQVFACMTRYHAADLSCSRLGGLLKKSGSESNFLDACELDNQSKTRLTRGAEARLSAPAKTPSAKSAKGAKGIGGFTMIAIVRACALGIALLVTAIAAARAANQTVVVELGNVSTLALDKPYETVLIGAPDIIDVHRRDDRTVALEPLNPGVTNIVFVDDQNIVIANIELLVRQPAIGVIDRIPQLVRRSVR
ncbi:pilus assembly protein N-terminal domain-containing protein [Bradyrhizobium prioriisuperbiae]|uniref:pilus assembly protein N-terminal domain-containing protein n=1 Tax=Bradyrhizobium prioriisuperbiae TaxID=2854389 RepID=UPI0028E1C947|nr:pilus assembly protein N-terminal domain-containing protein [Bradyrhizobium prioritasuperba]